MSKKVNLIARIRSTHGCADDVLALLNAYALHVVAMDGTERFEVYRDRDDPAVLIVIERYRDDAAFREHIADPENGLLNRKLAQLTEGGSSLRFLVD